MKAPRFPVAPTVLNIRAAQLGSALTTDFRTKRFTWGFDIGLPGGSNLMLNHEHWSMPENLDSVDVFGLRWVLSF